MGLQSFKFKTDFMNQLEDPIIFVAKRNKSILAPITVYEDLSLEFNLNAYQTISFTVPMEKDGVVQECYKYLEESRLVMIQGVSWYEIHVEESNDGTGWKKTVTGNSLEIMLSKKNLVNFECNADDQILDDDYVKTIFYDSTNAKGSLLHRVLNVTSNWTVGHVDASLANKQRSFDIDSQDVYSFLTEDVAEAFNCLFVFDTFNYTVNAYDLDNYGEDTNIFISLDNLMNSVEVSIDENSIFTCYRVNGGDGIYINDVNPNGTNKIYNFNYYKSEFSEELQTKLENYEKKYQELKPSYENAIYNMQTCLEGIYELKTRTPSLLTSTNWTEYGSEMLEIRRKSYDNIDVMYKTMGYNNPTSPSYSLYTQNAELLNQVTQELEKRTNEIQAKTEEYNTIKAQRNEIQSQLDMDKWFTVEDWKELDLYVTEETYDNDNFEVVDTDDEAEILNQTRQLYEKANEDLAKKSRPQYQYSSTLYNVLSISEFKDFLDYFELGNFIRMETNYGEIIKLRLIGFTVDYSNTETISVTFSDAIRVNDVYNDMSSILEQASSAATSFQFNKDQYDKASAQSNYVEQLRKYGLDVAQTMITNGKNQSQTWDDSGMTFRMWNEEKTSYEPEQVKIINNMIAFTDDSWDSVKTVLGKIALSNGVYGFGLNTEFLLGKLTISENLWVENDSGTYKMDDKGFVASSGKNSVKIQPNQDGELFSIYKDTDKKFYIDSNGNVVFSGDLKGASGTFSGLLSGGSINIGNGTFTVDANGNMNASSGTFSGTLSGASGSFSGTIYASEGTIGGWNIGTGLYGTATFGGTQYQAQLIPGQISFINMTDTNDYIYMNPNGIGFANSLTSMSKDSVSTRQLYCQNLYFVGTSSPAIHCELNTLTFDTKENVHFNLTPYVDTSTEGYTGYVATRSWVENKYAAKTDLSDYALKTHTHSSYQTAAQVRSIVKSMVKSDALS